MTPAHDPRRFRAQLAGRILGLLGVAAILAPHASCGDGGAVTSGSHGGASTSGPGATTGGGTHPGSGGAGGKAGTGGDAITGGGAGIGGDGGVVPDAGSDADTVADAAADADAGTEVDAGMGGAGTGGAGGAGAGGGPPVVELCFGWPPTSGPVPADPGPCPTDSDEALAVFEALNCPRGFQPGQIVSDATFSADLCCYNVVVVACGVGGRPWMEGDRARVAAAARGVGSGGWSLGDRPRLDELTAGDRASLADTWTAAASFEHASVASFARFALDLLAVGAPADLVTLAHEAALDEIRHAQLCFALAAAYAGEEIAPGPFPLGGEVRVGASLAEIAASAALEGCVGETVAAVVAAEQLARATDPAVRAALARIADDEAGHAELGWRTVAWAISAGGNEVRGAVERALTAALRVRGDAIDDGGPPALDAHGQLDPATRAKAVASAMAEVVAPCARALLDRAEGPHMWRNATVTR